MMVSSSGNLFRAAGYLCGEFTSHRWIPRTKASDAELWCILWSAPEWTEIWDAIAPIMTSLCTILLRGMGTKRRTPTHCHFGARNCTNNLLFAFITPADERGCYTWRGLIAHTSETTLQSGWHFTFCVWITSLLHFKHIEVGKNGRHFTDDIFNCISLKENFQILNKITLKYIP